MGDALRRRIRQDRFESPLQEAVLNLMVAADHVRDLMERGCAEAGISGSQYNVLRILRGVHPAGHPRCEIARRMVERAPDVTRLIDRLEKQGLVERDRTERDRRLSISRITPAGLDLVARLEPQLRRFHQILSERLPESDCAELSRICEGIYAEAETDVPDCLESAPELEESEAGRLVEVGGRDEGR